MAKEKQPDPHGTKLMVGLNGAQGFGKLFIGELKKGLVTSSPAFTNGPAKAVEFDRVQIIPGSLRYGKCGVVQYTLNGLSSLHLMKVIGDAFRLSMMPDIAF